MIEIIQGDITKLKVDLATRKCFAAAGPKQRELLSQSRDLFYYGIFLSISLDRPPFHWYSYVY